MKNLFSAITAAALLSAAPFQAATADNAGDRSTPSLMFYSAIPLDGSPRQKDVAMRFGFRLDQARNSGPGIGRDRMDYPIHFRFSTPALLDFSVNGNRLPEMKINGISALTYSLVSNVAGGAVVTGVNWTYVGYGVVAALAVDMELDDDDPECNTPDVKFMANVVVDEECNPRNNID